MKSFLQKLLFTTSVAAMVVSTSFLFLTIGGLRLFIVRSGSMEPAFPKGSLVLINTRLTPADVRIEDVLAYRPEAGTLVLHRLVGLAASASAGISSHGKKQKAATAVTAIFQGDANETKESVPLTDDNLIGKAVYTFYLPGIARLLPDVGATQRVIWVLVVVFVLLSCVPWEQKKHTSHSLTRQSPLFPREFPQEPDFQSFERLDAFYLSNQDYLDS